MKKQGNRSRNRSSDQEKGLLGKKVKKQGQEHQRSRNRDRKRSKEKRSYTVEKRSRSSKKRSRNKDIKIQETETRSRNKDREKVKGQVIKRQVKTLREVNGHKVKEQTPSDRSQERLKK